ncbi:endonuclease-reverse transcriptase [Clonorchis sinensis]|uniref:Endonuclease-reverse transcriptase n=1 Tax=Clonorchis sinensis TaxID=79923 RepID=G7Y797_CLOSI|nr:endonuclease-reverse transcriptase [Clonorchis sinensis]
MIDNLKIIQACHRVGSERCIIVRYELLVLNPERELKALTTKLEFDVNHPGQEWCECQFNEYRNKLRTTPWIVRCNPSKHQFLNTDIMLSIMMMPSECKSKAGLVAHHGVHDNDSVGTNMVAQLACADCSRLFPTKIGLSQHRRHAHPTQHNADKLSRVKHSGARWSQQESQSLLRLANNLYPSCETQTALFARLEQYFPGRSAISIKTRLRVLNWTFPHTWKTVSRRRHQLAHRMPVNRKQIRRANYAAIQTLYHQRRKDAASAVLDGSWKDLYKGNCGLPPDAEQYWKQVLSAPKHVDSRPSRVIVPSDWSLIEPITGEEVGRTVRSMGNSSPGLDKLTPRMLRRFNANPSIPAYSLVAEKETMLSWKYSQTEAKQQPTICVLDPVLLARQCKDKPIYDKW